MHTIVRDIAEALAEVDTAGVDVVEAVADVFASYGADTAYMFGHAEREEFYRIALPEDEADDAISYFRYLNEKGIK